MQCVVLNSDSDIKTVSRIDRIDHKGNPKKVFIEYFNSINIYNIDRVAVTGRDFRNCVNLSSISEPEAVEKALREEFKDKQYPQMVVSCGGETQLAYKISSKGGIVSVHSGNKCASGTGEFFQQQIRRMGLEIDNAVKLASQGAPYKIAGRCSVFCKSDSTHALNKGEPIQNIVAGLCFMMVEKIDELIKDMPSKTILVTGGGALNTAMLDVFKKFHATVYTPDIASVFEAYGAALWALDNPCIELSMDVADVIKDSVTPLTYHSPLSLSEHLVDFKEPRKGTPQKGDDCIIGLDVGSTTTKAILLRLSDDKILADVYLRTNGNPIKASRACYKGLLDQIGNSKVSVIGLGVTGSGRQIAGLHALTDNVINEIIAHATAASFYDCEVDTIFEIGGQDAKYTFLTQGIPSDYAMNEACSAGTGSFLEESAFETLGVKTEAIGNYALQAPNPPDFTDQCAAFISSDIKRAAQQGVRKNDILAGLVYSICLNYINRVKGNRKVGKKIFMQGGVCYNKAVPIAMASLLDTNIVVPPEPGLMGAFGVALEVKNRLEMGITKKRRFNLAELAIRDAQKETTFTCAGGKEKCDRKCTISRMRINKKLYAFGGICDRYYNIRIKRRVGNVVENDMVAQRQKIMFDVYGPTKPLLRNEFGHVPRTIGLNNSLLLHSLFPLFSNFFTRLGMRIVLPEKINEEGILRTEAAFCRPVEIAHGGFYNLLQQQCDYIFIPQVMQLPVANVPTFSRLCPFIQGEPYYLKSTFRNELENSGTIILDPVLKMEDGYDKPVDIFIDIAAGLGISEKHAKNAYLYACEKQIAFEKELHRRGKKLLYSLEKDPDKTVIVLFGRPYNAFAEEANMGIPHKVASRNYVIVPYDMLPADEYSVDNKMFWAMGQKIMKSAQFVKRHRSLFGFYITNFSCGPDSFLLNYFRDAMGSKPSLTLELDQHTADAGIDTRIEAAIDIIERYRRLKMPVKKVPDTYTPARVEWPYVFSSQNEKLKMTDSRIELLIPSMGQMGAQAVAATFRSMGIDAKALPVLDKEGFVTGKRNTSCKECLPYIITTGSFLKYLETKKDSNKVSLLFMATGGGPCRLGQYFRAFEQIVHKKRICNAAMLTVTDENGYGGLGSVNLLKAWQGILLSDVLGDIKSMLAVVAKDKDYANNVFNSSWKKCLSYFEGKLSVRLSSLLKFISLDLAKIPLKMDPLDVPVISLVGEIFVRRDEFARKNIVEYFEKRGFMVRVAPVGEYLCYGNYIVNTGLGERKFTVQEHIKMRLTASMQDWWEKRIKVILAKSGLYEPELIDVEKTIRGIQHLINENFRGECILTVGLGMREILEESCGVVSIGPFGCMYSRMAEAILKKEMNCAGKSRVPGGKHIISDFEDINELPFLSIETDGSPFTQLTEANLESFVLQARRVHRKLMIQKGREETVVPETVTEIVSKR